MLSCPRMTTQHFCILLSQTIKGGGAVSIDLAGKLPAVFNQKSI